MNDADFIAVFPRLSHVTDGGAWPSIKERGLLSTSALLDLYGVRGSDRAIFESERRGATMTLKGDGLPDVVLRDRTPMSDQALRSCPLDGMTPRQWYECLNGKVFFWTSERRLQRLVVARAGRDVRQIVLTVDARSLLAAHRDRIRVSGMNTGATVRRRLPRGPRTFLPISECPYDERRKTRSPSDALVELTAAAAVPDITDHLLAVDEVTKGRRTEIWGRPISTGNKAT